MASVPDTNERFEALMGGVATSVGPVVERYGYRWASIAPFGMAPQTPGEARLVHRSRDGRTATVYEVFASSTAFDQPAFDGDEVFYVVEGVVVQTAGDGTETRWTSGDLGYLGYQCASHLRYVAGTRLVRFIWSSTLLPECVGKPTSGPMQGSPPSRADAPRPARFHVQDDRSDRAVTYHGQPTYNVPIFESEDHRVVAMYGFLPEGARFEDPPANVEETFFIVQGALKITPEEGEALRWQAGDLVYWPYERNQTNRYGKGLGCVCFFWSDQPLVDYVSGASTGDMAAL